MPLTDTTIPYEILVRFGLDGTVQGAHVQRRRLLIDGGAVLLDQPLPAEALGVSDFPTSEVMTEATAGALTTVNRQATQIATLQAEKDNLLALNAQLVEQIAIMQAALLPGEAA